METENKKNNAEKWERWAAQHHKESRIGRILAGLIVIGIGALLLARQAGAILPEWLFTWKMLLIGIGLFIGAKRGFRPGGWLIPMAVGAVFLIDDFNPGVHISHLLWPMVIIIFGLILIFKPRRSHWHHRHWGNWEQYAEAQSQDATEDRIDCTAVFSGVKKNIISKNFKGGEVTCFFGGAEINLTRADIDGNVVIDSTQVFGGAKYIIPPHWKIQSETTTVFGSIEDNRPLQNENVIDQNKVLILKGTCVFGGIEINSY